MKNLFGKVKGKVNETIDRLVVKGRLAVVDAMHEEKGATDFVAIAVIIVILLVVVIAFKNQMLNIVNTLGDKVTDWINSN